MKSADDVIDFWFEQLKPQDWWKKSDAFDQQIHNLFATTHAAAVKGECHQWRETPLGRLAEIIVIDQFCATCFCGTAQSFVYDPIAVVLSQEAVRQGADKLLVADSQKSFLYMPLMHSESLLIHDLAVKLFDQPGLENNLNFELKHKAIIDQFGRYPHRNDILGRESTPEEIEFLDGPNSSF